MTNAKQKAKKEKKAKERKEKARRARAKHAELKKTDKEHEKNSPSRDSLGPKGGSKRVSSKPSGASSSQSHRTQGK
jgi:hypothetical protein